ncbi:hypothetical protein UCRPC4_g00756 [Phaeomoniella chlamydospora]|uniref:Uncharacterized protein n=1 Tax=Phaeomoniella chlamydospora TaxID=158046 RepID=A0A0G2EZA3_PHACM|nr:hypothetical protein UCRPC4_g00756 [Phaeomoniella chlamydospora]
MKIQAPSLLAQLPQPLTVADSQIRCGQVYSVEGPKRRKRHELAVGIDGEAVNIYNVSLGPRAKQDILLIKNQIQSGNIKTSYATPPQSSFSCPPCSVRYTVEGQLPERRTFCAFTSPEAEIWLFSEKYDLNGKLIHSTSKYVLDAAENPVIYLDTLREGIASNGPDLLVVRKDGRVDRLTSDLKRQVWSIQCCPLSDAGGEKQVIAATIASFEEASTGIFKKRPDIVSTMPFGTQGAGQHSPVLLLVVRNSGGENNTWHSVLFQAHILPDVGSHLDDARIPLLVNKFPEPERWSSKANAQVTIDPGKGSVDVSFEKGIVTYDVTGYAARMTTHFISEIEVFSSLRRLNSSLVVAASASAITLYDAKYRSSLSGLAVDQLLVNRKRKRETGHAIEKPILFIAFYPRLGSLIALRGTSLLSLDMSTDDQLKGYFGTRRKLGLLANAIGKGTCDSTSKKMKRAKEFGPAFGEANQYRDQGHIDRWTSRKEFLDTILDTKNYRRFEEEIALDLFRLGDDTPVPSNIYESPATTVPGHEHISYALSRCFSISHASSDPNGLPRHIEANTGLPRLLRWLIQTGLVTKSSVRAALGIGVAHDLEPFSIVGLCGALGVSDNSSDFALELLEKTPSLESSELISIIQHWIIDVLTSKAQIKVSKFQDAGIVNGNISGIEQYPGAVSVVQPTDNEAVILTALNQLAKKPRNAIISAARSGFKKDAVLALIQYLRQQLFEGGYTTSFRSQSHPTVTASSDPGHRDQSINSSRALELDSIIKLLSCCIDVLGSAAVLSTEDEFVQSLIADLRTEVSSALEGVDEAAYLQGILREVWRYAASGLNKFSSDLEASPKSRRQPGQTQSGDIITLFSETTEDQFEGAATSGMLPLTLKVEAGVSDYKVRKGGGQVLQRSAREKAGLQNRAIGKYSRERLVL